MPRRSSSRRSTSRSRPADSSGDDDEVGAPASSRKQLVSPRILDAAKNSEKRRKNEESKEKEDLSASRSARRERRKSRRGSKKPVVEGKSLDDAGAAERDARAQRRAARRNKRTPRHDSARRGFFASGGSAEDGGLSSSGLSRSRGSGGAPSPELTKVEVIAWQHQSKMTAPGDTESDDSDAGLNAVLNDSDVDDRPSPRRHPQPKAGGAWGTRQSVPEDSDTTAGIKGRHVRNFVGAM